MDILRFRMKPLGADNDPYPFEPPKEGCAVVRTPASVAGLTKQPSDHTPRFLPLILLLSVLFWVFTTTGGRQVFVKEMLGGAYDSQAEHFLRGDVDVDAEAISHEAMIVNDHVRMYFGPFPALLRVPLNFAYPAGHGKWSRISGFCAAVVALFAVAGLAWSMAALCFAFRSRQADGAALTRSLLGFSLCTAGALLSRVTFGIPFILIALLLAIQVGREKRLTNLLALFLPLGAALAFYVWLSYARFGTFTGVNYDYYINPVHSEFAHKYGIFSPRRMPYSVVYYFSLPLPSLERRPPFAAVDRHLYNYPSIFSNPASEVYISLLWSSSWLVFAVIMGIVCLVRRKVDLLGWSIAAAFVVQFLCILSYFVLAQRYATDFYPFLIFCLIIFLCSVGSELLWSRHIIIGLIALSVVINSLATVSWLVDADLNVPVETRAAWEKLLGRHSYEKWK